MAVPTFSTATDRYSLLFGVNVNKCVPHMLEHLMHIRLELECSDVEELDGAARPVYSYDIQLLPRL